MIPSDTRDGKCRGPAAYHLAQGSKTNAWHLYVKGPAEEPDTDTVADKNGRVGIVSDKRAEFMALSSAEKQPWEDKAAKARSRSRVHQAPVLLRWPLDLHIMSSSSLCCTHVALVQHLPLPLPLPWP